eukprot:TRINITY_DN540_c0_g1_i2.p1 TRINITY_DN540_c0_g1~~TRINITY_DN540_c0_g1_i2.p1  ORF type:complete len:592 (-),score=194.68 TRINITY_DN540_c0_g1_i2:127-1902(-)
MMPMTDADFEEVVVVPTTIIPPQTEPKFRHLNPRFLLVFLSLAVISFLACLDSTILSTALPKIAEDLNQLDLYAWVINSFLISSTVMIPLSASLGEVVGRKNLLLVSIFIFIFGSILCASAQSMTALVVFRAIQGLGAGPIQSLSSIIVNDIVPDRFGSKFNGILGAFTVFSVVGGPVFGGIIADQNTWRLIFFINIPIGVPAAIAIWYFLNYEKERMARAIESESSHQTKMVEISTNEKSGFAKQDVLSADLEARDTEKRSNTPYFAPRTVPPKPTSAEKRTILSRIDWLGIFLLITSILLSLLASSFGSAGTFSWRSSQIGGMFGGGAGAFALFLLNEALIAKDPVIPLKQFLKMEVSFIYISKFCGSFILMGCVSYLPIYFQIVRGDSPTFSGVRMLPLMFGFMLTCLVSGFVVSKRGIGWPFPIIGMALTTLAVGLLSLVGTSTEYVPIFIWLLILGFGLGFATQVITVLLTSAIDKNETAATISTETFIRTVGGIVGVQVFQIVIQWYLFKNLSGKINADFDNLSRQAIMALPISQQSLVLETYTQAIKVLFYILVPLAGISFFMSIPLYKIKVPQKQAKLNISGI